MTPQHPDILFALADVCIFAALVGFGFAYQGFNIELELETQKLTHVLIVLFVFEAVPHPAQILAILAPIAFVLLLSQVR